MGQAKQRGTFEQRKVAAETRQINEQLQKRKEREAREAMMTPQERSKKSANQHKLNVLLTAALIVSANLNSK